MKRHHHRETLQRAIHELPVYEPDAGLWDAIERELDRGEQQDPLRRALQDLPHHDPPAELWGSIERELPGPARIRWFHPRVAAVAAALAVVTLALYWLFTGTDSTQVELVYSEEIAPAALPMNWNEDQEAIQLIVDRFETQPAFLNDDSHDRLLLELQELDRAQAELSSAIERYGADDHLAREMARIERERTDILEEMAAQI